VPISIKCTGFSVSENGHVNINLDDGTAPEFSSLTEVQEYAAAVDGPQAGETAVRMLVAHGLALNPDPTSLGSIVGKRLTFDMGAVSPILITAD